MLKPLFSIFNPNFSAFTALSCPIISFKGVSFSVVFHLSFFSSKLNFNLSGDNSEIILPSIIFFMVF